MGVICGEETRFGGLLEFDHFIDLLGDINWLVELDLNIQFVIVKELGCLVGERFGAAVGLAATDASLGAVHLLSYCTGRTLRDTDAV